VSPVAAVDCGTNSIKLLVRDRDRILLRDSRVVRLGQGVDRTGRLAPEALARTFAAVEEFAGLIAEHDVPPAHVRFCATSASRDAENAEEFTTGVEQRLGVRPEVLSGAEEAALVYAGAVGGLAGTPVEPVLVVDIGGGSTELVLGGGSGRDATPDATAAAVSSAVSGAVSMDIGSVRLHERHLHDDPPTAAQVAACVADIDQHLDDAGIDVGSARTVIGTSGTVKTIACGVLDLPAYDREAFDGALLEVPAILAYVDSLVAMTVAERRALPYMHPGRADVIDAGALIWSRILRRATTDTATISEADLLHGIAGALLAQQADAG